MKSEPPVGVPFQNRRNTMGTWQFYGWEQATVPAHTEDYPGIRTPRDLYDQLSDGV